MKYMKTQPIIKNENLKAIYRTICRNRFASRAGVARELGLSKPTVSLLTEELIRGGFICESSESGELQNRTGRRPTCLAPRCLDGTSLHGEEHIIIVGIKGLKDFYGNILQENLRRSLDGRTEFPVVEVETPLQGGRDITTLDVARWLDTEDGRNSLVRQLKPYVKSDSTVFIVPQILGTKGQECAAALHELLGAELLETTCLPPKPSSMASGAFKSCVQLPSTMNL